MVCTLIGDQYRGAGIPLSPSPPPSFSATLEDFRNPRGHTDVTRKRKRSQSEPKTASYERLTAANRVTQAVAGEKKRRIATPSDNACEHPIQFWTQTGRWPRNLAQMSQERSVSPKKRVRTSSYTQSVQDGEAPRAYSPAYEKILAENGIHMEESKGRGLVKQESRDRCTKMLLSTCEEPRYTMFPLTSFLEVWERARNRNEIRILRDITSLLVPSPELLVINGHAELEYIVEELNAEWTKCKPIAGPRPKPDLAMGISSSAFTTEEIAKLKNYSSLERPTQFTEYMYFPFLLCEVKSGDQAIDRADRQNIHSGSMACHAILKLEESAGENKIQQLNGEILVYSISHDNERVKIYGHFAAIQAERVTYHRFPIGSFVLNFEEGQGRKRTHDFVREVYRTAFPKHLKRIRGSLEKMDDPRAQMVTNSLGQVELGMPVVEASTSSTQDTGTFKMPGTPASKQHQEELSLIREQFAQQERLYKEQIMSQEKQHRDLMAQQEKQYREQLDLLKGLLHRQ